MILTACSVDPVETPLCPEVLEPETVVEEAVVEEAVVPSAVIDFASIAEGVFGWNDGGEYLTLKKTLGLLAKEYPK